MRDVHVACVFIPFCFWEYTNFSEFGNSFRNHEARIIVAHYDLQGIDVDTLREKYAEAELCIRKKEKADIYDFVEDVLRNKGYSVDKESLRRAIARPHRTICNPLSHEDERRRAIRDGFMEMLRKELLDPSLEKDIREQFLSGY